MISPSPASSDLVEHISAQSGSLPSARRLVPYLTNSAVELSASGPPAQKVVVHDRAKQLGTFWIIQRQQSATETVEQTESGRRPGFIAEIRRAANIVGDLFEKRIGLVKIGQCLTPLRRSGLCMLSFSWFVDLAWRNGKTLDRQAEAVDAVTLGDRSCYNRNASSVCRTKLLGDIGDGLISSGQIGFVDDDDVGDFQNAGLLPLQFVAGLRLQNEHDDVSHLTDRDVSLPAPTVSTKMRSKPNAFITPSISSMFCAMPCCPETVARLLMKIRSETLKRRRCDSGRRAAHRR